MAWLLGCMALANPAVAEPGSDRFPLPEWSVIQQQMESPDAKTRGEMWTRIKSAGVWAIPTLERIAYEREHRQQALEHLAALAKHESSHVAFSAFRCMKRLADSDDFHVANQLSPLFAKLSEYGVERLKSKGLILREDRLYDALTVGYRAVVSSDWKGPGEELVFLNYLYGDVQFFGGFFGTTDGECMRALCQVPKLQRMLIADGDFNDEDLRNLGNLTEIDQLSMSFVPVTDKGLRGLSQMKHLEALFLRELPITDETFLRLKGPNLPRLEQFVATGTGLSDLGLSILYGKSAPNILEISKTLVTDAGLAKLDFEGMTEVYLELGQTAVTGKWLAALSNAKLEKAELDFSHTPFHEESLKHLAGQDIRTLNLQGTPVLGTGLKHLQSMKRLSNLDLSQTDLRDEAVVWLPKVPYLSRLKLYETSLTNEGLKHLGQIKSLDALDLSRTNIDDAGLLHLSQCEGLEKLAVAGTHVTGTAFQKLTHWKLEQLDVSDTKLQDSALEAIGKIRTLKVLKLKGTHISNAGLAALAGLENLQVLELDRTNIDGSGIKFLTGLKELIAISLNGSAIKDDDLPVFRAVDHQLEIHLQYTRVTPDGIGKLVRELRKTDRGPYLHLSQTPDFKTLEDELDDEPGGGWITLHSPADTQSPLGQLFQDAISPFGMSAVEALGFFGPTN